MSHFDSLLGVQNMSLDEEKNSSPLERVLKDETNGRDRAARLEEWSHSSAGIRDDPPNDPGWRSVQVTWKNKF